MCIIAKDGSGDFTSIQEAIDAISNNSNTTLSNSTLPSPTSTITSAPTILIVRTGEYHERVAINKDNLRIVGESPDSTIITYSNENFIETQQNSLVDNPNLCTLLISGNDIEIENLTIRSSCAVAVQVTGDRVVWRNCHFTPTQTLNHENSAIATSTAQGEGNMPTGVRIPTWYLCGDSTMADYPSSRAPMTGWGQMLPQVLAERYPDHTIYVQNCAVNGRSSKSFIDEGRLHFIELCLRPGDKIFIQFGHNDEKLDPARHTSSRRTYPARLSIFIATALRHGAQPILFTPIARRRFDPDGNLIPTHGRYPDAMRALARRRNILLLDMEIATSNYLKSLGANRSKALYNWVPAGHPNYPDGASDNTHLSQDGALCFARLALDLLEKTQKL